MGDILPDDWTGAGIDRVVVFELHSAALESAFPMPVVQLRADDVALRESLR